VDDAVPRGGQPGGQTVDGRSSAWGRRWTVDAAPTLLWTEGTLRPQPVHTPPRGPDRL